MLSLAQLDIAEMAGEARVRALLEDLIESYRGGVRPGYELALAVWYGKSHGQHEHNLLMLFKGRTLTPMFYDDRLPLLWKTDSGGPPFVSTRSTTVDQFAGELSRNPQGLDNYFERFEVLYFDKHLLTETILNAFKVLTEPSQLLKGWYVSVHEYEGTEPPKVRNLLSSRAGWRPEIGLVKIEESQDFEYCRGLLHAEFQQKWLPLSHGGLSSFSFYTDCGDGRPGYFLFEGGSLYRLLKFEVKTAPEYSTRVLEKSRDDRYPEVHLRAVHPPELSAA